MNESKGPNEHGLSHVGANGPRMVNVGGKPHTAREAAAEAVVRVGEALAASIRGQRGKKGDVLAVAQLAGIQAVKHTATVIPLCHPLPIDGVDVDATLTDGRVRVTATVRTTWKTGVEMEALHAASVAALTVIDMGKSVQRGLAIEGVRLLEKTGGQRGDYRAGDPEEGGQTTADGGQAGERWPAVRCGVLTVSDRAASGGYDDRSGPAVAAWLATRVGADAVAAAVVPDEREAVASRLRGWCDSLPGGDASGPGVGLVLTTGGTGLAERDITPEVTASLIERFHPGLVELARQATGRDQPLAYLSRGVAGVRGRTLIVNLPGSPRGAVQWLDAVGPVLPHALRTLAGKASP